MQTLPLVQGENDYDHIEPRSIFSASLGHRSGALVGNLATAVGPGGQRPLPAVASGDVGEFRRGVGAVNPLRAGGHLTAAVYSRLSPLQF